MVPAEVQSQLVIEKILGIDALSFAAPRTVGAPTDKRPAHLTFDPGDEAGVTPYPSREARAVVEVGVELFGTGNVVQGLAQGIPSSAESGCGRRPFGADDDVGTRFICEFLDDGTDRALRAHLGQDGGSRHVGRLDLEPGRETRDEPFDDHTLRQGHPYVQATIRRILVASPRHRRRRKPATFQFGFADAPDQLP
jgi:hypothetical protein